MKSFVTQNSRETQKLAEAWSKKIQSGRILALTGELGAGKTTFAQGLLEALGAEGPYTSPTFLIMKKYRENIFHFDAYRVEKNDIMNLGWEEIVSNPKNIVIVEWADRISGIIPQDALWINFEWLDENKRKITVS